MRRRFVLVTGASTGIGLAIVKELASSGFHVFAGSRNPNAGGHLATPIDNVTWLVLDPTDEISVAECFREVAARLGGLELFALVNNAGTALFGPLELLPMSDVQGLFQVNTFAALRMIQTFLPLIRTARGRVINISSVSGQVSTPFLGAYAASKFALEALSTALRIELMQWNIKVVLVNPGNVRTPIWEKTLTHARALYAGLPKPIAQLYSRAFERASKHAEGLGAEAVPPNKIAEKVREILTTASPKPRYVIGNDARFLVLTNRISPTKLMDWLFAKALGLK